MTITQWLTSATATIRDAAVPTARLDALVLLEDTTGKDRAWLLAHDDTALLPEQIEQLDAYITRRANHEPLSYIRGKTEFYGRSFYVDARVLEPRPESETMIELLKTVAKPHDTIIDIGTGSGALAVTAQLEVSDATVIGVDIDVDCLAVAQQNRQYHSVDFTLLQSDLLTTLSDKQTANAVLLCNLPYVPDGHTINAAAMFEPTLAIFGGHDGLDPFRELFSQIGVRTGKPRLILTESLPFQHQTLVDIAAAQGYRQQIKDDFIQLFVIDA